MAHPFSSNNGAAGAPMAKSAQMVAHCWGARGIICLNLTLKEPWLIMSFFPASFECSGCGILLEKDIENNTLLPCKNCGSTISNQIKDIRKTLTIKMKPAGKSGDPNIKIKIYNDFHKDTKEWRQVKMTISKQDDCYEKVVINPETDEELFRKKEKLTEHKGHGSAKNKK
jgi:DNA-directed RNA polymerase subunit RPC12/RpoP